MPIAAFTNSAVLARGRRHAIVGIDGTQGTIITTDLGDPTSALLGSASYGFHPTTLADDQEVMARHMVCGTATGTICLSYDTGHSWFPFAVNPGVPASAVASGEVATPDYPLAYAGFRDGSLWSYTEDHGHAAQGAWTQVGSTGAPITALTVPVGGHGRVWVASQDGSLWIYTPALGLLAVANLGATIPVLAHLEDPGVVYGLAAPTGLFSAMELSIGAAVFSLDSSQTYTGIATAGTRALAAAGSASVLWSPDGGVSLGTLAPLPVAGPYQAAALCHGDPNEAYVLAGTGTLYRTLDNGATWAATATAPGAGITALLADPHHDGVLYATGAGAILVTYDAGASWGSLFPNPTTCFGLGALCLYAENMVGPILSSVGSSFTGGAHAGSFDSQSFTGGAHAGSFDSFSFTGGGSAGSTATNSFTGGASS